MYFVPKSVTHLSAPPLKSGSGIGSKWDQTPPSGFGVGTRSNLKIVVVLDLHGCLHTHDKRNTCNRTDARGLAFNCSTPFTFLSLFWTAVFWRSEGTAPGQNGENNGDVGASGAMF